MLAPDVVMQEIWRQLQRVVLGAHAPPVPKDSIIAAFGEAMAWQLPMHRRTATGRDPTPLRAVRLTEWGQLVVRGVDEGPAAQETTLTAEYLF